MCPTCFYHECVVFNLDGFKVNNHCLNGNPWFLCEFQFGARGPFGAMPNHMIDLDVGDEPNSKKSHQFWMVSTSPPVLVYEYISYIEAR